MIRHAEIVISMRIFNEMSSPLVLIPGLLCRTRLFASQIGRLQRMMNVLSLEEILYEHNDMKAMAKAALHTLPSKFSLAGFSMGGYLALEIAHQAPERVERFSLICSQAKADSASTRERRLNSISLAKQEGDLVSVFKQQFPLLMHEHCIPADAMARIDAAASAGSNDYARLLRLQSFQHENTAKFDAFNTVVDMALRSTVDGYINQQTAIMSRSDHTHTLEQIAARGVPTLIACGDQDRLIPLAVHRTMYNKAKSAYQSHKHQTSASDTSHVSLLQVPKCGHMLPLEQSDALTDALQTWLRIPASA